MHAGRLDWSDRYAGIVDEAKRLRCRSAVIDGEVVALDQEGKPDFEGLRAATRLRTSRLVYIAFDLLFIDGVDLRTAPIEERREELSLLIPRSPKSRVQVSEAIDGDGAAVFAAAERMGLEGIVSKRRGSRYKSGRVDSWRKTKAWAESNLILVGVDVDKRTGTPMALLAHRDEAGLRYAGGAFFALKGRQREMLREPSSSGWRWHAPAYFAPAASIAAWTAPAVALNRESKALGVPEPPEPAVPVGGGLTAGNAPADLSAGGGSALLSVALASLASGP